MPRAIPDEGKIFDYGLPALLFHLHQSRKTGILTLRHDSQEKSIYFKSGDIIFSSSNSPEDRLVQYLLRKGRISEDQRERVSRIMASGNRRFGAILVDLEILSPQELFGFVTGQVKEIIRSLFVWTDADFYFKAGDRFQDEVITIKMSAANIILDGIKTIREIEAIRRMLPPAETVYQMTDDPRILFQDIDLTDEEQDVLALVDGEKTSDEIFRTSPLSELETTRLLYFFISSRLVDVREDADERAGVSQNSSEDSLRKEKQKAYNEALHEHSISRGGGDSGGGGKIREIIEAAFLAMASQDHYEVLGLTSDATSAQIKKAYIKLAKDYHPDRHYQAGFETMTDKLEALFARITDAYNILLSEQQRKEYDSTLLQKTVKTGRQKEQADGKSPEDQFKKGEAAYRQGEIKAAAYYLEAAIQGSPDNGRYHALLGRTLARLRGRGRDAEKHYKRAIELEPANYQYSIELGRFYKKNGMKRLARKQFEAVLKWDPENSAIQAEIAGLES